MKDVLHPCSQAILERGENVSGSNLGQRRGMKIPSIQATNNRLPRGMDGDTQGTAKALPHTGASRAALKNCIDRVSAMQPTLLCWFHTTGWG